MARGQFILSENSEGVVFEGASYIQKWPEASLFLVNQSPRGTFLMCEFVKEEGFLS